MFLILKDERKIYNPGFSYLQAKISSSVQLHCSAGDFNTFNFDPFNLLTFLKSSFTIVDQIATWSCNLSNSLIPLNVFQVWHLIYLNKSKTVHLLLFLPKD